jgi:hypothetical protein
MALTKKVTDLGWAASRSINSVCTLTDDEHAPMVARERGRKKRYDVVNGWSRCVINRCLEEVNVGLFTDHQLFEFHAEEVRGFSCILGLDSELWCIGYHGKETMIGAEERGEECRIDPTRERQTDTRMRPEIGHDAFKSVLDNRHITIRANKIRFTRDTVHDLSAALTGIYPNRGMFTRSDTADTFYVRLCAKYGSEEVMLDDRILTNGPLRDR